MDKPIRGKETIIVASQSHVDQYLKRCWNLRRMIWSFAIRDIKVRYAQTFLGFFWALIQPVTGVLVYTLFFGYLLELQTPDTPYLLYVLIGVLGWNYFIYLLNQGATAIIDAQALLRKVYVPGMTILLSKILVGFTDYLISLILIVILLIYYEISPGWHLFLFPFCLAVNLLMGLGAATVLSALTIRRRDLVHIVPYIAYFAIWFTPVFYPISIIPEHLQHWMQLNPLAGLIKWYRYALLGGQMPHWNYLIPMGLFVLLIIPGVFLMNRVDKKLAEDI